MVNSSLDFPWVSFMLPVTRRTLLGARYVQIGNADGGVARHWDMSDACLFLDRVWNGKASCIQQAICLLGWGMAIVGFAVKLT